MLKNVTSSNHRHCKVKDPAHQLILLAIHFVAADRRIDSDLNDSPI